nr:unnamed protein product [Callosobruchus analis]
MTTAWTSPYTPVLTHDKKHFNISEEEASHLPMIPFVTVALTSPFVQFLPDKYGRKYAALISAIPYFISWILKLFSRSIYIFYVSQALQGVAECIVYSVIPMYVGEVATPTIRGRFGSAMTVLNYFGQFFVNVIGTCLTIPQSSVIGAAVPILFFLIFCTMPESPYYLIMRQEGDKAEKSLLWLRGTEDVSKELAQIRSDMARQMSEKGTWMELVTVEPNRKALIAGMFLRIAQQLSGMTVFFGYTKYIFEKSSSTVSANMSIVLFSALNCIMNAASSYTSEYLGRKSYFIISLVMCSLSLLPLTFYFYVLECHPDINLANWYWVPLASLLSYVTFCAFGIARIPTLMAGELFSSNTKAKGLCVLGVVMGSVMGLVTQAFYYLSSTFGTYTPFALFTVCSISSALLTPYIVPETRGKTLEEIQQSLRRKGSVVTR